MRSNANVGALTGLSANVLNPMADGETIWRG